MHDLTPEDAAAARRVTEWALARLADRRHSLRRLDPRVATPEVSSSGAGPEAVIDALVDSMLPSGLAADHPRYLAYVPSSPTPVAVMVDLALSAASLFGGAAAEAPALVEAENAVLRWLAEAAGLPAAAGGTFVSGGTLANLSALVVARGDRYLDPACRLVVTGASAHSSLAADALVMGCEVVAARPADEYGRLDAASLRECLDDRDPRSVVAVVATAGATNNGAVDDLAGVAGVCRDLGLWLHVDAAYGAAALLSPRLRPLFDGIQCCDSLTIDPHKWLFAPYDAAAIIYRDPAGAARVLTQRADYLGSMVEEGTIDPSHLAVHLSRRARGIPLWASLAAYGTDAYVTAVETCLETAAYAAAGIRSHRRLELVVEPSLSVVLFRRLGWQPDDYARWSSAAIEDGLAVVTPTRHAGETVFRFCFVNPLTTPSDVDQILAALG